MCVCERAIISRVCLIKKLSLFNKKKVRFVWISPVRLNECLDAFMYVYVSVRGYVCLCVRACVFVCARARACYLKGFFLYFCISINFTDHE